MDNRDHQHKGVGGTVEAVEKALQILEAVGKARKIGVLKLSQQIKLPYSTVHRLLGTLAHRDYIQQDGDRQRYALGPKVLELGTAFLDTVESRGIALPYMRTLSQETRETVNLVIWNGRTAVCAEKIDSPESVTVQRTQIGRLEPLHSSALGKAIIANLSEKELTEVLKHLDLVRHTSKTHTSLSALMADLQKTRERGFAIDDEEGVIGVRCVASAILGHRKEVQGALSLVGPSTRMTKKRILELGCIIRDAANSVSLRLGYNPRQEGL